jgi:DNA-binding NarL/FixJ family response regulator
MVPIRIYIVEDHPIFLEALISLLQQDQGLEVVGSATDALLAIKHINKLKPDVVVTDLTMPKMQGQQLIAAAKKRNPEIKAVVLSMHKSEKYLRSSIDAGTDGYVLKDDTHLDLVKAIHRVHIGKHYISPGITTFTTGDFLGKESRASADIPHKEVLTSRERQILKLIAEGETNDSIAAFLSISSKTVEKHRSNIMEKLNLHNAALLTRYAIENNYL